MSDKTLQGHLHMQSKW